SLYQLPATRVVESRLCREHYRAHDPSALLPDGSVPEELCKVEAVQQRLGRIQGLGEMLWVAGDFFMTIPLVSLADHRGHHFVLCLNLVPRAVLLGWTFAVGYFDQGLPVHAILAAPALSLLGGDCVFNSIVYALVSELTDDHVLRATFFGYVNAVTSIFSLQLGPALASASMSALLWLPLWIGIFLLLLAVPAVSALRLPSRPQHRNLHLDSDPEANDPSTPLIPPQNSPPRTSSSDSDSESNRTRPALAARTTARLRALRRLLAAPSRNLALLLAVFFLAALASADTRLLPLYVSARYAWRLADVGYLLSAKAGWNFVWLSLVVPWALRWRRKQRRRRQGWRGGCYHRAEDAVTGDADTDTDTDADADAENVVLARACLAVSVLGALAIALAPSIAVLLPALLLYALGIALPMFTYSLLRSPSMGVVADAPGGPGSHLFSLVMLVRTVASLLGAALMPSLWVAGLGLGGAALGLPFMASAACYAFAWVLVARIEV
ncbi:uncharacterized protein THITE_2031644, partial [Thermothielavioides terrestris NRRL 8126]